jgi:aminotransferase EvaB
MAPGCNVPFFSAQAVNAGAGVVEALVRAATSGRLVLGPECNRFEAQFADYCSARGCAGVANGTDALEIALRAAGVGAGSNVALAANAGYYGSAAVRAIGAVPVYVDVDAGTLTISPDRLAAVAARTQLHATIATHLYGTAAAIADIAQVCERAGIALVEDCAQAHGLRVGGRHVGTWGLFGCFSFYPTKNLGALGDAGALISSDADALARARSLRQYGWSSKYHNDWGGGRNSRLDELQAAVLLAKLPHLEQHNAARRQIATRYDEALRDLPLRLPAPVESVHHLYVVRTPMREGLRQFLEQRGIASDVHYPIPDHRQKIEAGSAHPPLPVCEEACAQVLSLPCYPGMPAAHVEAVIEGVRAFFAQQERP